MLTKIIIIILIIQILDNIITMLYASIAKKYHARLKANEHNRINEYSDKTQGSSLLRRLYVFYGGWVRYKIICLGRVPSHTYRKCKLKFIYRMNIGTKTVIYGGFEFRDPWNIRIGDRSIIGDEAKMDGRNGIDIGADVNMSTGVWIWTEQHDINDPFFGTNNKGGKVTVLDKAWIGSRVTMLPGIRVGYGAVLASGAVVTKDCDEYSVNGGVPSQKIGERSHDLRYSFDGSHFPFY